MSQPKGATTKQPTNPQDQGEPYKVGNQLLYRTNKTSNLFSLSRYIVLYILSSLYKAKIQTEWYDPLVFNTAPKG